MSSQKDYYATLGVLPSAENVVIKAAYRALAQRYHPDRASINTADTKLRMAEINEAYAVLSDPRLRKEYDHSRGGGTQSADAYFSEKPEDEPSSSDPLETDWKVAVSFFPDLIELERRLARVSWRLAYAFRAHMLEGKAFQRRHSIAEAAESQFLTTYFGSNSKVLIFARSIISSGHKSAAKALNEAVRVLGTGIDPDVLIRKISRDFGLESLKEADKRNADLRRRAQAIRDNPRTPVDEKIDLLHRIGGRFEWDKGMFTSSCRVKLNHVEYTFTDGQAFSQWIVRDVVPMLLDH